MHVAGHLREAVGKGPHHWLFCLIIEPGQPVAARDCEDRNCAYELALAEMFEDWISGRNILQHTGRLEQINRASDRFLAKAFAHATAGSAFLLPALITDPGWEGNGRRAFRGTSQFRPSDHRFLQSGSRAYRKRRAPYPLRTSVNTTTALDIFTVTALPLGSWNSHDHSSMGSATSLQPLDRRRAFVIAYN